MILYGSKYVIYGADVNHGGSVDLNYNAIIENDAFNFVSGYVVTDVNGDEIVDLNDQAIADNNGFNFVTAITPLSSPGLLAKKGIVLGNITQQNSVITEAQIPATENKIDYEIYEKSRNDNQIKKRNEYEIYDRVKGNRVIRIKP